MKAYELYTQTSAPWLINIPTHWDCKKISELFIQRKVKVSDKEYAALSVAKVGIVPQLETAVKTDNGDNRKLVCTGDFVINSRSDRKGSCGVSPTEGSVSLINIVLQPCREWNSNYVHYLLRSHLFSEEYYRNGRGIVADLWATRYSEMKTIMLPVPPHEEQDQIVRYLDWQVSKTNKLISMLKKQVALLKELKQAVINEAMIKGLDPNVTMKDSGIDWIGEIPSHWSVLYLFQVATEQSISNRTVHNQNLLSLSYGKIKNKDINSTDGLLPASFVTYQIVTDGNIILRLTDLQNDHTSLRVGLVTQTGIITSAYTCLLPGVSVLPEYLYLLLHSYDVRKVFYGMGGGVRQSIGYKDIKKLPILLLSLQEQQKIVTYCFEKQSHIEEHIENIELEITLLKEYRTCLISDVVTGQTDVRDIEVPHFEYIPDEAGDVFVDENIDTEEMVD